MNPNELAFAIGDTLGHAVVWFCTVTPFILAAIAIYLVARRMKRRGLSAPILVTDLADIAEQVGAPADLATGLAECGGHV